MALLDDEETGAAFGFFPQMQPRRRLQDVQGSANLPVDVTRGRLAGLLGLIPDVLNFMGRSPMPTETFGETQYNPRPQLPYDTDFYLKNLPLAPTSRAGQVAGQAASFVPLNPAPLVRAGFAGAQALAPTAARMTERYMQRQGFMPSVVPEQPSGLLTPEIPAPKPQAPVSDLGFYSAAEQAAMNLQRGKGTGQSFLNDLMKAPDVKKDELQYTGLNEFLKDKPNVTRQEVTDYLSKNKVDVEEVTLGGDKLEQFLDSERVKLSNLTPEKLSEALDMPPSYAVELLNNQKRQDAINTILESQRSYYSGNLEDLPGGGGAKFNQYQLPGGENYREILFKLPLKEKPITDLDIEKWYKNTYANDIVSDAGPNWRNRREDFIQEMTSSQREDRVGGGYISSHFDEPNILAHMRVNDRIDADGKKMLLIEEVQSDWHQAGREKGYKNKSGQYGEKVSPEEYKRGVALQNQQRNQSGPLTPSEQAELNDIMGRHEASIVGGRVPDAPFKDTWYQLALKRALKEAVDKGYDRIGLTTGAQQASRYDLSKQVDNLLYSKNPDGTYRVSAQVQGRGQMIGEAIPESKLSDYVGKEVAEKMSKGTGKQTEVAGEYDPASMTSNKKYMTELSGIDLKVGGEGMKKYYDEIYPAFLNKQGKKYGAQVGETEIGLPPKTSNSWAYFRDWFAENHGNVGSSNTALSNWEQGANNKYVKEFEKFRKAATQTETVRYLDITPEMRKAVQKGQPLFTAAPIGGIGTGLLSDEQRKELSGLLAP